MPGKTLSAGLAKNEKEKYAWHSYNIAMLYVLFREFRTWGEIKCTESVFVKMSA